MRNLKVFNTQDEHESVYNSNAYIEPWVSYIISTNGLVYNKMVSPIDVDEYANETASVVLKLSIPEGTNNGFKSIYPANLSSSFTSFTIDGEEFINMSNPYVLSDGEHTLKLYGTGDLTSGGFHHMPFWQWTQELAILDNVSNIPVNPNTQNIEKVTLKNCVIPESMFGGSPYLKMKEIVIGEGIETIPCWTFKNCSNLEKITIAPTVKEFGGDAFYGLSTAFVPLHEGLEKVHSTQNVKPYIHDNTLIFPSTIKEIFTKDNNITNSTDLRSNDILTIVCKSDTLPTFGSFNSNKNCIWYVKEDLIDNYKNKIYEGFMPPTESEKNLLVIKPLTEYKG
jgi:hypothetical protein